MRLVRKFSLVAFLSFTTFFSVRAGMLFGEFLNYQHGTVVVLADEVFIMYLPDPDSVPVCIAR